VKLFLLKNKENGDYNQYWYSDKTILFLANQAIKSERCCFLSAPSIYYSIDNPQHSLPIYLFDVYNNITSTILNSAAITLTSTSTILTILKTYQKSIITSSTSYSQTLPSSLKQCGSSMPSPSARSSRKIKTET
jgi:hypothetical protein